MESIIDGVNKYLDDNSQTEIWVKIFPILHSYLPTDSRLSTDSQKLINFYLGRVSDLEHPLRKFFYSNKETICLIYDLLVSTKDETIDEVVAMGLADERVFKKN